MARIFVDPSVKFAQYVAMLSLVAPFLTACCAFLGPIPPQEEDSPSWSPDGKRIAYECYVDGPTEDIAEWNGSHFTEEAADICTVDVDGRNQIRLTKEAGADHHPLWSPSGAQITYTRGDGIYVINADGSNQRHLVRTMDMGNPGDVGVAWSPDGSQLLFSVCLQSFDRRDVYLVDADTGALTNLTSQSDSYNAGPAWTLNGKKIAFWSASAGLTACFPDVRSTIRLKAINADGTGEKVLYDKEISMPAFSVSNTGQIAFLRSNGTELYTIGLDGNEPVKMPASYHLGLSSPDGKYLIYEDRGPQLLEVMTGESRRLPEIPRTQRYFGYNYYLIDDASSWSPDSLEVAFTTSAIPTGFYTEKHIHIFNLQSNSFRPLIQH
jgi:Tol biopolymer transport system component